jgi:hypothetical protein
MELTNRHENSINIKGPESTILLGAQKIKKSINHTQQSNLMTQRIVCDILLLARIIRDSPMHPCAKRKSNLCHTCVGIIARFLTVGGYETQNQNVRFLYPLTSTFITCEISCLDLLGFTSVACISHPDMFFVRLELSSILSDSHIKTVPCSSLL